MDPYPRSWRWGWNLSELGQGIRDQGGSWGFSHGCVKRGKGQSTPRESEQLLAFSSQHCGGVDVGGAYGGEQGACGSDQEE